MNADQRQGVRDTARYLREVRPIDPDEIHEYVEGQPHPAAVRQVLRESSFELEMREREDGTFEPVDDRPVRVTFHTVGCTSFPDFAGTAGEIPVNSYNRPYHWSAEHPTVSARRGALAHTPRWAR